MVDIAKFFPGSLPSASRTRWLILTTVAVVISLVPELLLAQQVQPVVQPPMINREHQIKAAYLYNFARYIQWPKDSFTNEKEPFVIGVMGSDPIVKELQKLAKSRTVDNHPIEVKQFASMKDMTPCHILFFSPMLDPLLQQKVLQAVTGRKVLLVGQTNNFLNQGGVISFVSQDNRIRLVIDLEAVQREKLKISAKLLRVAQVVE